MGLFLLILLGGLLFFLWEYVTQAEKWVSFSGSPHLYNSSNIGCGTITDRSGNLLLDISQGRTYSEDANTRKSTLHWLGDKNGFISASTVSTYAASMVGYDRVNGVYNASGEGGNARLTISAKVQNAALEAMGNRKGTVGVYNYKTGEILCAVTSPSYDPDNVPDIANDTTGAYDGVYVNRFFSATYTPGSIFKVLTTAAALEQVAGIADQTFYCEGSTIVDGELITCTGVHGTQTLGQALSNSCNVAFAEITQQVGRENMEAYVEKAGIRSRLSLDGVTTAAGNFDVSDASVPSLAWSGIGQYTDLVNPCQYMVFMGMIANGGEAALPHLMQQITEGSSVKYEAKTEMLKSGLAPSTTELIARMMRDNVVNSYGTGLFPDVEVCAKSGTAETGEGKAPNAMFAGFVKDERYPLAFIVVVEEGGYGSQTAAPIAGQVLSACIADLDGGN